MKDEQYMCEALALAREAAQEGEVPVGAVIVRDADGAIVGRGRNRREAIRHALSHAEIEAIDEACRTLGGWRLSGCTLYVTLEPCPMCAGAIINARIDRVVYGTADPKAGSCGSLVDLFAVPYNHHPVCEHGVCAEECADELRMFFKALREKKKGTASTPAKRNTARGLCTQYDLIENLPPKAKIPPPAASCAGKNAAGTSVRRSFRCGRKRCVRCKAAVSNKKQENSDV